MLRNRVAWRLLLAATAACIGSPAFADPDKDESGHGKRHYDRGDHRSGHVYRGGGHKEEYWDGHCKVERKHDKRGGYKEERKCSSYGGHGPHYDPYYGAAPAPGVYVQPPGVVIQPPTVVIR